MSKKPTVPLKVTATLIDGRINSADSIIMFDGILYHAWFAKYAPEVLLGGGAGDGCKVSNIGLPLRQINGNRWAASMGIYSEISQEIEYWNKRPDFFNSGKIDFLQDKGLISDSVGLYRAYRIPNLIRTVRDCKIDFYCMGHVNGILDLLSYIPAVGKKPSMGWGFVSQWEVEEIDIDYSLIHPEYGLMRPLPIEEKNTVDLNLSHYPVLKYGVKPPYWKEMNKRLCYVPTM